MASNFGFHHICKAFGNQKANEDVSFEVLEKSIHGIVGENGAGKSTIMKILYGLYQPDSGHLTIHGKETKIVNPSVAITNGIGMVHQHFRLVPTFTVWQNLVLGQEDFFIDKKALLAQFEKSKKEFGLSLPLEAITGSLSVGEQQQLEIFKLLHRKSQILILDEPTAVLTPQEVDRLFDQLKMLKEMGRTIVIITHKLKEVLAITDRVTVMRKGKVIATGETSTYTEQALAEAIIGRKRDLPHAVKKNRGVVPWIKIRDLTLGTRLNGLSFEIYPGEIVGIAGVEGNGQQELIECLVGHRRGYGGSIEFNEKDIRALNPFKRREMGLGIIPSDRQKEGSVLDFSVRDNFILGRTRASEFSKKGVLQQRLIELNARNLVAQYQVVPFDIESPLRNLSGGNQQKVIVAREARKNLKFLLVAHPTRGVDIGSAEFIYSQFFKLKEMGVALLVISSDLDELFLVSDRVLVLYQGRFTGEAVSERIDERQIGLWMTGAL